ncbi:3-ketoacyl-CoA synthase 6-like [Dioscorea cayenensis subsp. rotundata]|uniref:3-ketoacyl-CoA synthase n=1 Tax=Dioscorea cayennensis subsp. rotundata TaxID=55577 RepID=A0AB40BK82_DIOCR|nr:3-ketoacyl-CoA synthase 6-like [Dioscorea cayenensis subsp. rotundata]
MLISSSSSLKPILLSFPLLLTLLLLSQSSHHHHHHHHHLFLTSFLFLLLLLTLYFLSRPRPIYLLNYSCFKPTPTCRVPFSTYMEHARQMPFFDDRSVRFQTLILERSGLGEETCLPPPHHYIPPTPSLSSSLHETHTVLFSAIDHLLKLTSIHPHLIDILVINCSLFYPIPSLSSIIINHYNLRTDIRSFNLSGMGCSAGLISVDLARDVLQVHPNSLALVLSTEIITPNYYAGKERAMLLPNCLFRMGASAVLLSNRSCDASIAKYKLLHVVRTHKGSDDKAHSCVFQEQDSEGNLGINLSKDLMAIAGDTLKSNITSIGPLVLPASEQLLFLFTFIARKLINPKLKPYIPDFKQAFEHFCIHAGGRAVIDELQKNLQLSAEHVEASRMTLHRFGNTSSSSLWYELSYIESKGRMRRGDRVWMIGFGSGFKCNSAVWKCLQTVKTPVEGPWSECIHRYPVHIPEVVKLL